MGRSVLSLFKKMINTSQAKSYCCEDISLIENYAEAVASPVKWECHHRAEILPCGHYSADDLIKFGLYENRPASELIFMTEHDHRGLHHIGEKNPMYGKHHTEEAKSKMSQLKLGEKNNFYGKHHTETAKEKQRQANLGLKFFNDGTRCIRAKTCPPGFRPGRTIPKAQNGK